MTTRFEHLDGLRGLAAINVVLGHALVAFDFALYTGNPGESHAAWDGALSGLPFLLPVAGQNFSVCIFLVMSGFVLAHAFGATTLGAPALAAKRYTRLAIPIAAATLFSWALLASGLIFSAAAVPGTRSAWLATQMTGSASFPRALTEGLFGALLGPWSYTSSYDSSLWTMSIEFAGSLLLIGVFAGRRWCGRAGQHRLLCGAILALIGAVLYPTYVSLVMFGAAICQVDLRRRRLSGPLGAGLVALAVLMGTVPYSAARGPVWDAVVALVPAHAFPLPFDRLGPGAAPMDRPSIWHGLGAVLLLIVVQCSPGLRRVLSGRRLGFLGLVSFRSMCCMCPCCFPSDAACSCSRAAPGCRTALPSARPSFATSRPHSAWPALPPGCLSARPFGPQTASATSSNRQQAEPSARGLARPFHPRCPPNPLGS